MDKEREETRQWGWLAFFALALAFVFLFTPGGSLEKAASVSRGQNAEMERLELERTEIEVSASALDTPVPTAPPRAGAAASLTPSTPAPTSTPFADIIDESRDITSSLQVEVWEGEKGDYVYQAASVKVEEADQLRTAFAQGEYGKSYREYSSKMARDNGAVIAVNGDYYGFRNNGIVIRNGVLYRNAPSSKDLLIVDRDGNMSIAPEKEADGEALIQDGVWQSFSFGPGLVEGGRIKPLPEKYMVSVRAREPRTAVGQTGPLSYLLVTVEGRNARSRGASLSELAELMAELGCQTAYNLDGGGSSTMVFREDVVNGVSGRGERAISDILYFVKAE